MIPNMGKGGAGADGPVLATKSSSGYTLPTLEDVGGFLSGALNGAMNSPLNPFVAAQGAMNAMGKGFGTGGGIGGVMNPFASPNGAGVGRTGAGTDGPPYGMQTYGGNYMSVGANQRDMMMGAGSPFAQNTSGGLGTGGGIGSSLKSLGGNAGGLGTGQGGPGGGSRLDAIKLRMNKDLGDGWWDKFTAQNGMDPIHFYDRAVPAHITDPAERASIAEGMARNDAKYQPAEIADWQQKHGNVAIPPEQWAKWWKINQNGGPSYQGEGVDPYGVS